MRKRENLNIIIFISIIIKRYFIRIPWNEFDDEEFAWLFSKADDDGCFCFNTVGLLFENSDVCLL